MPRITSGLSSRPDYKDRSPTQRTIDASSNPGTTPVGDTQIGSFTCPAGKLAIVEFAQLIVMNIGTAAVNGDARATMTFTPSGSSEANVFRAFMPRNGEMASEAVGLQKLLKAGDAIKCYGASNNSAASSNIFIRATCMIVEFDA